jgi:4'-phosphopantetheinyl transferase
MPLIKMQTSGSQSAWALWFISENEQELTSMVEERPEPTLVIVTKRLEWLAGRLLLQQITEQLELDYQGTLKNEFGKPLLKNLPHHISLSHSFPYVAAQIDLHQEIGIDLEQPKSKLLKIAHRVLSPTELIDAGTDIVKHCVYWCAKETLYKAYGKRGLHFSDQLQVKPFELLNTGDLHGKINAKDGSRDLTMTYLIQPDYVLVHTKTQPT